ncbi:MAG TPA: Hsp20/alpha crystallin family protein [Candidatus Paceibacterota bacterium]|nr:Hsp20/alpha crystallin family protein [Candidatus Paceibacterota bacterium]
MQKDRRSFFERITGSISLSEEDQQLEPIAPPVQRSAQPQPTNWMEEETEEAELSVDVYQTATEIVVETMIAGVKPEDINISITREMVTIQGKREKASGVSDADYFQKELFWGNFSRSILLPNEVEAEEAEAIERHGLLTIRLPKINKDKIQKLKVKSI